MCREESNVDMSIEKGDEEMLAAKPKPIESLDKYMTDEAVQNVINIIDNPPAPNDYLKRAIAKFMSAKSRDNDES